MVMSAASGQPTHQAPVTRHGRLRPVCLCPPFVLCGSHVSRGRYPPLFWRSFDEGAPLWDRSGSESSLRGVCSPSQGGHTFPKPDKFKFLCTGSLPYSGCFHSLLSTSHGSCLHYIRAFRGLVSSYVGRQAPLSSLGLCRLW